MKKVKSKDALLVDNFQPSGGNLGSAKSGLPSKTALKIGKKKSSQKDGMSEVSGNIQISVKDKDSMQDLPTRTKIRLKDNAYSQHQVENNVSNLQDTKKFVNEESKDGEFHRDKRPRVSQVEDISSKRKSAEARVLLGSKEHPRGRSIEKEPVVKQPREKPVLTKEDIDKLRKDLGVEETPMAATSSSSKISDSRKNRLSYLEREGSPVESVSSSPMRKVDFNFKEKKFQEMNQSSGLGSGIMDSKNKLKKKTAVDETRKHEVSSNMRHPLSNDSNLKSAKNNASVGKNNLRKSNDSRSEKQSSQTEHDKNDLKSSYVTQNLSKSSLEQAQVAPWDGKVRIDLRQGVKQGGLCPNKNASVSLKRNRPEIRPDDTSVVGDTLKAQKSTENYTGNEPEKSVAPDGNKNVSGVTASTAVKAAEDVLKEAEELKTHADLIKVFL